MPCNVCPEVTDSDPVGEHMSTSTDEEEDAQFAKYELALEYADKAVSLAPDQSVTYLRRAIANGRIALFQGVFSVAGVVEEVRLDCEKAIELNQDKCVKCMRKMFDVGWRYSEKQK